MAGPLAVADAGATDDVVAVEVTIDGMLVIADRLQLTDFPATLGIRPNIPHEEVRELVWDQVARDLTAQGVLDAYGRPHPAVAMMADTVSRPDRTLECRWWRPDAGDRMIRFALCRKGERHVIAVRDDSMLVLQLVAAHVGPARMLTTVLGTAEPAPVEPLTALAAELGRCRSPAQIAAHGVGSASARSYSEIIAAPTSWVEIVASQRHQGGTVTHTDVAAGVLNSASGRVVSLPRRVCGQLYGSFLPGTEDNIQRAVDALLEFLPAGGWPDHNDTAAPACASPR